jgi:hypothetical protein
MSCHLKRGFSRSNFSSNIIKTSVLKRLSIEKKKKKKKEETEKERKKLQESPQIKGEVNILRG